MKVIVQRVDSSFVLVSDKETGRINKGLLLLVGFTHNDTIENIKYMVNKIVNLRIFDDENNIMNLSVKDIKGSILSVSQFTLYADTNKGNRPSYINAMKQDKARELYKIFNDELKKEIPVAEGIFQSEMKVHLINDGPVTIILER